MKVKLKQFKVESFVTVLDGVMAKTVRGGESVTGDGGCCISEEECLETRCMCAK